MSKLSLPTINSLTNQESAIQALAEWKDALEAFSDLVLSRNGASPNTLTADLDMNSNRLLNLAAPVNDNDAVRLIDVVDGIQGPQGETGPAGSVSDGDKGDIVVTGSGATWTLDSGVVTAAARTVLDDASITDMRATLLLGTAAILNTGTTAGTVALADDTRFSQFAVDTQNVDYSIPIYTGPTIVYHTNAGTHTYTLEHTGVTNYPVGYTVWFYNNAGGGNVTIAPGASAAVRTNGAVVSASATLSAGGWCSYTHFGTGTWVGAGVGLA